MVWGVEIHREYDRSVGIVEVDEEQIKRALKPDRESWIREEELLPTLSTAPQKTVSN